MSLWKRRLKDNGASLPLPSLGDSRKVYMVALTEPEINAIHSVSGFLEGMIKPLPRNQTTEVTFRWYEHYVPTFKALSERLQMFDDGDAPLPATAKEPSDQTG